MNFGWNKLWRICRFLFVLLCGVIPAVVILIQALWIRAPLCRQLFEHELAAIVGQPVSVEGLSNPRPGVRQISRLILGRSSSVSLPPCTIRELLWKADRRGDSIHLKAMAAHVDVNLAASAEWLRVADEVLCFLASQPSRRIAIRLDIKELGLFHQQTRIPLRKGLAEIAKVDGELQAIIRLWTDEDASGNPAEIRFFREAAAGDLKAWGFHTGDRDIPAEILGHWVPGFRLAGKGTSFRGYVWQVVENGKDRTEVSGRYWFPQLEAVLGGAFSAGFSGTGELVVHKALSEDGRWIHAVGTLRIASARIAPAYLQQVSESLNLRLVNARPGAGGVRVGGIALDFALADNVLRLNSEMPALGATAPQDSDVCLVHFSEAALPWPDYLWMFLPGKGNSFTLTSEVAQLFAAFLPRNGETFTQSAAGAIARRDSPP